MNHAAGISAECPYAWDKLQVYRLLAQVRFIQGCLSGKLGSLAKDLKKEAASEILSLEISKTAEIEGEFLDYDRIKAITGEYHNNDTLTNTDNTERESILARLLLNAAKTIEDPVSVEQIVEWHHLISEPVENLNEIKSLSHWINHNDEEDWIIKAGIAHLWCLKSNHSRPGKRIVARTVSEHLLARSEKGAERFFSLSSQLRKERKAYIENLEKYCSGNLEITPWLLWWLTCITYALKSTESVLSRILYKAEFRKVYSATPLNERQRKMIDLLLGEFQGRLTSTKWAEITGSSPDSALRDIQDLISKKILKREDGGGRSTCYDLNFRGME